MYLVNLPQVLGGLCARNGRISDCYNGVFSDQAGLEKGVEYFSGKDLEPFKERNSGTDWGKWRKSVFHRYGNKW